jgi:vacuolar-type H+-ATPase subunit B/Vma2
VGPALPAPTTRSGAATTGKLIDRQIGIQGKLIGRQIDIQGKPIDIQGKLIDIQGKPISMQGKRESKSLFPLLEVCFLC